MKTVYSSLAAVGLTAAVSTKLAEHGISANVIAAYYHEHIFVQAERAKHALSILNDFSCLIIDNVFKNHWFSESTYFP